MSYLEEWEKIEKKYDYHTAKDLALIHIAKCLSILADTFVGVENKVKNVMDYDPYVNICHIIHKEENDG